MPIPSVSSSASTHQGLDEVVKCKLVVSETTILNDQDNKKQDTIETDSSNDNKKSYTELKKKKALLLHARHEDEDKVVNLSEHRLCPVSISGLYAGSKFYGTQKCGPASYEVHVELLHVDMKESTLNGYLEIKGLTSEFPELTTFFEAEIMGPKYSFHTRKWQADQKSDLLHWKKFPSFKPYVDIFNNDDFVYQPTDDCDFIYMRWKEVFLVPDHRVSTIHGASFAGFYYICYQRSTNQIKGFYFFRNHKDWFQELTLNHVHERAFGKFEFR
ncbi:vacuolar import and degradation protein-domain-containing protein [Thamnidium elegans]|uniref:Glucose-induced degradation protein 4 homolog n=1 Tax=Thamnidium elegans TaxID=101142 RepID=A0A8H7SIH1_9FUNG|nr:hypothetical protein INT48_007775 [Thamnidium elegans]KAI8095905.1 vacuolar import and degradation protein-domain-containing protein [Thamnidium elegans]